MTYLNNCRVNVPYDCVAGTGLVAVHRYIFKDKRNVSKAELVRDLSKFYSDEKNIRAIWESFDACERDFIACIVRYKGTEYAPLTLAYAKKHGLSLKYTNSEGHQVSITNDHSSSSIKFLRLLINRNPKTKVPLLFPSGKDMPPFILAALQKVIPPIGYEYNKYNPAKTSRIICREHRLNDFAAIVRFAIDEKLRVKTRTYDVTKTKLVKMSEAIGFEEVCEKNGKFCAPKESKHNNDFKVAPFLFALTANSKLIEIDTEGNVSPGKNASFLLMMPPHELAKKIFTDYSRENKIYEAHYKVDIVSRHEEQIIEWHKCRKPIFELLKTCPIETFINFEEFSNHAMAFCGDFFRQALHKAITRGHYFDNYEQWTIFEPRWDGCEEQIIRLILTFLSALGMIDIAYAQNIPQTTILHPTYFVGITGFRITKLGAWILGMTPKYDAPRAYSAQNDVGDLVVLPDYSVVISGLKCRIEREPHLSRFLTKISSDENASVYKLDFKSIIRAYNDDIPPTKIIQYLKNSSSKPVPDNVLRTLSDWQAKIGRVKIRDLMILETDDALLLEEIKHIKAMNEIIIDDLPHAVILANNSQKKAKIIIEKHGWLVEIEKHSQPDT
ncbi:MAG: helicase-associated domain-containing protein [Nitrososphaerota archaeon]|nr:helicase-associated domain-containing protein [Nitrososphaerota archaeon]